MGAGCGTTGVGAAMGADGVGGGLALSFPFADPPRGRFSLREAGRVGAPTEAGRLEPDEVPAAVGGLGVAERDRDCALD